MIPNNELRNLVGKINDKTATAKEKDEYIEYLKEKNRITEQQYQDYKKNKNVDDILQIALVAGAGILLGILLGKLND